MLPVRSGASPLHPTRLRRAAEAGVMRINLHVSSLINLFQKNSCNSIYQLGNFVYTKYILQVKYSLFSDCLDISCEQSIRLLHFFSDFSIWV